MRNVQSSDPEAFITAVQEFFENSLFHSSRVYWKETVKPQISSRFIDGLKQEEMDPSYDLSKDFNSVTFQCLVDLISQDSGVRIRTKHLTEITPSFLEKQPVLLDNTQIYFRTKIKHMNFVLQDEANSLIQSAIRQIGSQDADDMLKRARSLYAECLTVKPDDYRCTNKTSSYLDLIS